MQTFARAGMGNRPDHAPAYSGHGTRAFLEEWKTEREEGKQAVYSTVLESLECRWN